MSKKKKKTRKEKEIVRHEFKVSEPKVEQSEGKVTEKSQTKESLVRPFVYADLRKVLQVMGVIVILIIIFTYLIYKTNIFDFVLNRLGLSY